MVSQDLNKAVMKYMTIRFIGRGIAGEPERCKALFPGVSGKLTKTGANRLPPMVDNNEFVLDVRSKISEQDAADVDENDAARDEAVREYKQFCKMKFGEDLHRLHEDSGLWTTANWATADPKKSEGKLRKALEGAISGGKGGKKRPAADPPSGGSGKDKKPKDD